MDKILLTDLQLFGNVSYYSNLVKYKKLKMEQYEHFKKGSYSNRYYIAGANGVQLLTIPLVHKNRNRTPLKDLKIANEDPWQKQHWRSLVSAYRKSPWFDYFEVDLNIIYNKKYKFLFDWNLDTFGLIQKWLKMNWEITWTTDYKKEYINTKIVDGRHQFKPSKSSECQIRYPQVFEEKNGFFSNLSVLDLLFCEGNNAKRILQEG